MQRAHILAHSGHPIFPGDSPVTCAVFDFLRRSPLCGPIFDLNAPAAGTKLEQCRQASKADRLSTLGSDFCLVVRNTSVTLRSIGGREAIAVASGFWRKRCITSADWRGKAWAL